MAPIASSVDCVGHMERDADCKSDARAADQHHEVNSGNASYVRLRVKPDIASQG